MHARTRCSNSFLPQPIRRKGVDSSLGVSVKTTPRKSALKTGHDSNRPRTCTSAPFPEPHFPRTRVDQTKPNPIFGHPVNRHEPHFPIWDRPPGLPRRARVRPPRVLNKLIRCAQRFGSDFFSFLLVSSGLCDSASEDGLMPVSSPKRRRTPASLPWSRSWRCCDTIA